MKIATGAAGLVPGGTFEEQFAKASEVGYDCVELWLWANGDTNGTLTLESTEEDYAKIRSLIKKYGVGVESIASGAYWSVGAFGSSDPAKSAEAVKILRKQLEAAKAIGADSILVVTNLDPDTEYMESVELTIKLFRDMREEIEETGVGIGLENVWNRFFMSPLDVIYVLEKIDNPLVGLYFDIGNMVAFSEPEYWITTLGKYIKKVHIKDFKRNKGYNSGGTFCGLFDGDVDFKKCMPLLKRAGYDGVITAEVGKTDPDITHEEHVEKLCRDMRKIANMAK
ncbi:MAG: sugar phosphate isomerase/epimerase [Clostridia bacterium]|nr:sugar phosphate isomerase/epimerase [Clostridia bacterium]